MAYAVEQQRRELGLRLALGATPASLLRAVCAEGIGLAASGTAIGLVLAFASISSMEGLLYETRTNDPLMFTMASVTLLAVAAAATVGAGLRASRVDPLVVLREE